METPKKFVCRATYYLPNSYDWIGHIEKIFIGDSLYQVMNYLVAVYPQVPTNAWTITEEDWTKE